MSCEVTVTVQWVGSVARIDVNFDPTNLRVDVAQRVREYVAALVGDIALALKPADEPVVRFRCKACGLPLVWERSWWHVPVDGGTPPAKDRGVCLAREGASKGVSDANAHLPVVVEQPASTVTLCDNCGLPICAPLDGEHVAGFKWVHTDNQRRSCLARGTAPAVGEYFATPKVVST